MRDFIEFIAISIATVGMIIVMVVLMIAASTAPIWVSLLLVKLLFFGATEKVELAKQATTVNACVTPTIQSEKP